MALVGTWRVLWLDGDKEEHLNLEPFDSVMWPIGCYRWFRYLGEGKGRLLTIIGGPDPGKVCRVCSKTPPRPGSGATRVERSRS